MGVTTIQSEQIKKSIKEIVDVVKAAGLPCTGEESFDDFVSKAKGHMEKASEHYHAVVMLKDMGKADHDALCTLEVAKAVNVMQQASKFSTLVGF